MEVEHVFLVITGVLFVSVLVASRHTPKRTEDEREAQVRWWAAFWTRYFG